MTTAKHSGASTATVKTGKLITVDWGTSNFRAALLDRDGNVLDRIQAPRGIRHLEKTAFADALNTLLQSWFTLLPDTPVLMAGMIGSADGLFEVPYLECPISLDAIADSLVRIPDVITRPVYIVPGLRGRSVAGNHDVMRGEEIQILGAMTADTPKNPIFCLPGTHSKWVVLEGRHVTSFSTSMTGDAYAALRNHTLLKRFAQSGEHDVDAFQQGLDMSGRPGGLLHYLFSTRSEVLLGELKPDAAASYLSGLLIGDEVQHMKDALQPESSVSLIGNGALNGLYAWALSAHGIDSRCIDGDSAAITGLHHLASCAAL